MKPSAPYSGVPPRNRGKPCKQPYKIRYFLFRNRNFCLNWQPSADSRFHAIPCCQNTTAGAPARSGAAPCKGALASGRKPQRACLAAEKGEQRLHPDLQCSLPFSFSAASAVLFTVSPKGAASQGAAGPHHAESDSSGSGGLRRIQGKVFLTSRKTVSTPTAWSRKPQTGRWRVRPGSLPRLFPGGFCSPGPSCPQWDRRRHPRAPERPRGASAHGSGR